MDKNNLQNTITAGCALDFICIHTECPYSNICSIFIAVKKKANNRFIFYNYGKAHGHHHKIDGRLKFQDILILYLTGIKNGLICPYCKKEMIFGGNEKNSVTVDHIISRARGGKNNLENLKLCCSECNNRKSIGESYGK